MPVLRFLFAQTNLRYQDVVADDFEVWFSMNKFRETYQRHPKSDAPTVTKAIVALAHKHPSLVNQANPSNGRTALHEAFAACDEERVEALMHEGGNLDAWDLVCDVLQ